MTPTEIMAAAAPLLLGGMLLTLSEMGRRGVLLRLEREARAQDQARADEYADLLQEALTREELVSATLRTTVHSLSDRLRTEWGVTGALRHDLHCATAHAARQAGTIAHQAETIDQLSLSVLGLHGQLIGTMIRAGEALTEAELAHPLPQHLPWNSGDYTVTDELKSGKAG